MGNGTSISRAVRSVADDYDATCKRLLSERQVLSRILHDWLDEYAVVSPEEIERTYLEGEPRVGQDRVDRDEAAAVRLLANEDAAAGEGAAVFDVRFEAWVPGTHGDGAGELLCMELDVEAQSDFSPGYPLPKRGVFYCGRMLSMQGGGIVVGSHYERVRKVVSVWVCVHPPRRCAGTVTCFSLRPERRVGDADFARGDYDLVELVMACLNDRDPGSSEGALGMLEVLLSTTMTPQEKLDILHDRYGIMVTKELREGVDGMCNLSKGVLDEGIAIGIEQGIERGVAQARKEYLAVASAMVRDGVMALQEAARRFGFTEQELAAAM